MANPVLDNVASGQVTFQESPTQLTIQQSSQKAIINWSSFNIGAQEATHFNQPAGGIAFNRINPAQGASQIYGSLSATGQIILMNPAGIYFGPTARVNVGGLIATTGQMTDESFLSGNYNITNVGTGVISNQGQIIAQDHGLVALLGGTVNNDGLIEANLGKVVLAAGDVYALTFAGDQLVSFAVKLDDDETTNDARSVSNTGTISANGGNIIVSARSASKVLDNVINMDGIAEAKSVGVVNGEIVLDGGDNGVVQIAGNVNASGKSSGQRGGKVKATGKYIRVAKTAVVDVSGDVGGGTVEIGGGYKGKGDLPHATAVIMEQGAKIDASAITDGDGGQVVLWSDYYTKAAGTILARGGEFGGNGGLVETSSKNILNIAGLTVDTRAPMGAKGEWLLDPYNVTINDTATTGGSFDNNNPNVFEPTADDSTILNTDIESNLALTDVTITTGAGGLQDGDITIDAPITWNSNSILKFDAAGNIIINDPIAGLNGSLVLSAGSLGHQITTGVNGDINVANFNLMRGTWNQVAVTLPAFNVSGNFQINSGAIFLDGMAIQDASFIRATSGNGITPYVITDIYGLQGISYSTNMGNNYRLGADIDASATANWNGGAGFVPIGITGAFTGTFDGQGYTISDLVINRPTFSDNAPLGLFAINQGVIEDTYLHNINYTAGASFFNGVGAFAGHDNGGSLFRVGASGTITGNGNDVGGLVGIQSGATITDAYSLVNVTGDAVVGGLVGLVDSSASIINTYAAGAVTGSFLVGGLSGYDNGTNIVFGSFWDVDATGQFSSGGVGEIGLTTSQMRNMAVYSGYLWDISNTFGGVTTWKIIDGGSYPYLPQFGYEGNLLINSPVSINVGTGDTFNLPGAISGNSNFNKYGDGNLVLSGNNTGYTGYTTIYNGILTAASNTALGSAGASVDVQSGATLDLAGISILDPIQLYLAGYGVGSLGALRDASSTYAGNITLMSPTSINVGAGDDLTLTGVISSADEFASLSKIGDGTLILAGDNTYNSNLFIDNGILSVTNSNALADYNDFPSNPDTVVASGATLNINNTTVANASIILNGDGVGGNGALTADGTSELLNSYIALNADSSIGVSAGSSLALNGTPISENPVSAGFSLTKFGAGTLEFGDTGFNKNSYSGTTTISAGTLKISNPQPFYDINYLSGSPLVVVDSGATLNINNQGIDGGIGVSNTVIQLNGNGVGGLGALTADGASSISNMPIVLNGDTSIGVSTGDTLSLFYSPISENIAGINLTKLGDGTLEFGTSYTNNSYTGATNVNAGILKLSDANSSNFSYNALGATSSVNVASGAALNLNNVFLTNNNIVLNGSGTAGEGAISADGNNVIDYSPITLNGDTTFGASTGSTLMLFESPITETAAGTNLTKVGDGTVEFNFASSPYTYSGDITVNDGTLYFSSSAALGATNSIIVNSGGTFKFSDFDISGTPITLNGAGYNNQGALLFDGSSSYKTISSNITMASDASIGVTSNNILQVDGILSGNYNFTKVGGGTLNFALNTAPAYTGTTNVQDGKLYVYNLAALPFTNLNVDAPGTVEFGASQSLPSMTGTGNVVPSLLQIGSDNSSSTFDGTLSGGGTLQKLGTGTLTLTQASPSFSGTTWLERGTVAINNAQSLGTSNMTFVGGTLQLNTNNLIIANNFGVFSPINVGDVSTITGTTNATFTGAGFINELLDIQNTGITTFSGTLTSFNFPFNYGLSINNPTATLVLSGDTSGLFTKLRIQDGTFNLATSGNFAVELGDSATALMTVNDNSTVAIGGLFGSGAGFGANSNINLGNNSQLTINQNFIGGYDGTISGNGSSIVKDGAAQLQLSGNNTYTGGTTLHNGTLVLGNDNAIGTGTLTIDNAGTGIGTIGSITLANDITVVSGANLSFIGGSGPFDALTLNGIISGAGGVSVDSGINGSLVLAGANTYTGGTSINNGSLLTLANTLALGNTATTLSIADTGRLGISGGITIQNPITYLGSGTLTNISGANTLTGAITLNGVTTMSNNSGSQLDINGIISDGTTAGSIVKNGFFPIYLANSNTYSGGTTISNGALIVGTNTSLGTGTLAFTGGSGELDAGVAGLNISNPIDLTASTLTTFGGNNDFTLSGNISLAPGSNNPILTLNGLNITLSGVMSGGGSSLSLTGGSYAITNHNTYDGGTSLNVVSVALGENDSLGSGLITIDQSTLSGISHDLTINNPYSIQTSALFDGAYNFTFTQGTTLVGDTIIYTYAPTLVRIQGVIDGVGALEKRFPGTLALDNANTYVGNTTLRDGLTIVGNDTSLSNGNVTVFLASLEAAQDNIKLDNPFSIVATLDITGSHSIELSNTVAINGGILDVSNTSSTTLSGVLSGAGLIQLINSGNLTITNNNSGFTGDVTLVAGAGTLSVGNNNALGDGSAGTLFMGGGTLAASTSGIIIPKAFSITGNSAIGGSQSITLSGAGSLFDTLNITNSADTTVSGALSQFGTLDQHGTGNLTLSGNNAAYVGNIVMDGGTLTIANNNALGNGGALIYNNGTLVNNVNGLLTLKNILLNNNLTYNSSNSATLSGVISGTGQLIKDGTSTLILNNNNLYSGGTTLLGGTLSIITNTSLGSGLLTLAGGSITIPVEALFPGITIANNFNVTGNTVINPGARDATFTGTGTLNAQLTNNSVGTITFSNDISGTGSFLQQATGTLALSGNNSFSGGVTLDTVNGTLAIGSNTALGTNTFTYNNGTLTTTVDNLTVANNIDLNNTLTYNSAFNLTLNGIIAQAGGFIKDGTGTLTLNGNNTFSGGMTLNNGTLAIGSDTALGTGTFTYNNGSLTTTVDNLIVANNIDLNNTLPYNSAFNLTLDGIIAQTGGLIKDGAGTLTLNGNNTYAGTTTINGGAIIANSNNALGIGSALSSTTINSGATLIINNAVINAEDVIINNGSLIGTGNSTLGGNITLLTNAIISSNTAGGNFNLNGNINTLNGLQTLALNGVGNMSLGGTLGDAINPLSALTTNTPQLNLNNATIHSTGDQLFNSAVVAAGGTSNLILEGGADSNITFANGLSGNNSIVMTGNAGNNTFTIANNLFVNNLAINGMGGTNTLLMLIPTAQNYLINTVDAGNMSGAFITGTGTFSNIANITSGNGNDVFTFTGTGALSGVLNASGGDDLLNYSGYTAPVSVIMSDPSIGAGTTYSSNNIVNGTIDPAFAISSFRNVDNVIGNGLGLFTVPPAKEFAIVITGRSSVSPNPLLPAPADQLFVGSGFVIDPINFQQFLFFLSQFPIISTTTPPLGFNFYVFNNNGIYDPQYFPDLIIYQFDPFFPPFKRMGCPP